MSLAARTTEKALFTSEQEERLKSWTTRYPFPSMGLIEALRDVQDWHRHISPEAEHYIAALFQVTRHHVREVATFYPYFTQRPGGKYRIEVCRNLSCHLAGCGKLFKHLEETLGVREGQPTQDGLISFDSAECLGACEHGPVVSVNDQMLGQGSPEMLDKLIADLKKGQPPAARAANEQYLDLPKTGVLTKDFDDPKLHELAAYRKHGGYEAWSKAKTMESAAIMEEVKKSNLRGLGGAGFPSGMKWSTVPAKKDRPVPHYLVANADESEPGCFKDRVLMERNPHALIEGLLIAGRAIEADGLFIFLRGEYTRAWKVLQTAIDEAKQAGVMDQEILIMRGANAYISGADTALLETMEGKKAWPRQPPPFPTVAGLMGQPTVVNNVETLMMVGPIIKNGGEWFAGLGVPKSGGTAVFSVSGHVAKPGIYEFKMGTPLMDIIRAAGGVRGGKRLKAVIPGGTSTPILTAAEAETAKMDFDSLRSFGTFLGAGGIIVLDETADMVETLRVIERFLAHESCGQCTPCREGSGWVTRILGRILSGRGVPEDIDNLVRIGENIFGKVICALGDTIGPVARAIITKFRGEFEAYVRKA